MRRRSSLSSQRRYTSLAVSRGEPCRNRLQRLDQHIILDRTFQWRLDEVNPCNWDAQVNEAECGALQHESDVGHRSDFGLLRNKIGLLALVKTAARSSAARSSTERIILPCNCGCSALAMELCHCLKVESFLAMAPFGKSTCRKPTGFAGRCLRSSLPHSLRRPS